MGYQKQIEGQRFDLEVLYLETVDKPQYLEFGLYNDSVDDLSETDTIQDIQTEPGGSYYDRHRVDFGTGMSIQSIGEDLALDIDGMDYLVNDQNGVVDSYFSLATVELSTDNSPTEHMLWTGPLGEEVDLSNWDRLVIDSVGHYTT